NVINTYIPYYIYDENSALIQLLEKFTNLHILNDMETINIGIDCKFIQNTYNSGYVKYILNGKQYIINS
ncbi:MAG: hypothetical protein ACI4TX_00845, partial [Christensenellales bacterium]